MTKFEWDPQPQGDVDSGRAPGTFPGQPYDCANAAVDPNNRDHFLFSKAGEYKAWVSKDGGKTAHEYTNHNTGVYFVMIDQKGWLYTATQAGAFVSMNDGKNWSAYHVFMERRDGSIVDRVPHDYQNIVPMFRGSGIAFPSDQGLHIVNGSELNLTSAVGDMANAMILSALIAPNEDGSRNLVCNIWDWDVVASFSDGAEWEGWNKTESSPGQCGEGGGGAAMGASGKMLMFHRNHWWFSGDGGHNFKMGNLPGGGGAFDYVRQAGSRTEPAGTVFAILDAPAPGSDDEDDKKGAVHDVAFAVAEDGSSGLDYEPTEKEGHATRDAAAAAAADDDDDGDDGDDDDEETDDEMDSEMDPGHIGYTYVE